MHPARLAERMEALLSGRGAHYAMVQHSIDHVPERLMRQTFPFRRQDLLDYLTSCGKPVETFARAHGFTLTESNGRVLIEEPDRYGPIKREFPLVEAARAFLTDYLLGHTYTGLDFTA
jgi:hypothetical protein